jgi:hypothetical protein
LSEGEFKQRAVHEAVIDVENIHQTITTTEGVNILTVTVPEDKYMVRMKDLFQWVDDARKEIFPIPTGDLPINPQTGQRDIIVLALKDWLPFINNLRKWFGTP